MALHPSIATQHRYLINMSLLTLVGVIMLAFWGAGSFLWEAPGIIHLFLSLGVFLIVLGIIKKPAR
jgi:type IV secretory pathway TrbL component